MANPPRSKLWLLVAACFTLLACARAVSLPSGGTPLFSGDLPSQFGFGPPADLATRTVVSVSGPPATQGWRISTLKDAKNQWDVELNATLPRAFSKGDRAVVVFWARAVRTPKDPLLGTGRMAVNLQKASADWDKSLAQTIQVGPEWREYAFRFEWIASYGNGGAMIALDFGFSEQDIEVAAIQVHHFGTAVALDSLPNTAVAYPGMEDGAAWRTEALARIETLRKGDFSVTVTDSGGTPLPGATVSVELIRHAFPFGSVIQSDRILNDDSAEGRTYRRKFLELFNSGGPENDLKWQPWAGDWGPGWTRDIAGGGLDWLKQRGIPARGHVMVWPGKRNLPKQIVDLIGSSQQNTIPAKVLSHIDDMAAFTQGRVAEWDVVNEPFDNFDLLTAFGNDIMVDWFKRAKEKIPSARLYLNDWGNHDMFADPAHVQFDIDTVKNLKAKGAPIEALGLQSHVGSAPAAPVHLLATLDRLSAETGLPLRITEFDSEIADDTIQANYMRDFLIAIFSHPAVNGFQMWGFWGKAHWIPRGALYRADFSEKPNGKAFRELVHGTWKTKVEGTTGANGRISGRGFFGDYRVSVEYNGQKSEEVFTLSSGAAADISMQMRGPRMLSLSTRGVVGPSTGSLNVGIAVPAGGTKKVLVRAIGPTLRAFGLTTALQTTRLVVTRIGSPNEEVIRRSGWSDAPDAPALRDAFANATGFGLQEGSLDSAAILDLTPGNYTFACESDDATAGVALIEVYELPSPGNAFVGLSTLGYTQPGEGILIAGLAVTGTQAKTYLIKGAGPTLEKIGVPGCVKRPRVVIFRGDTPLYANDGWEASPNRDALKAAMQPLGFVFPDGSADAAMLLTLPVGNYTIHCGGGANEQGRVLLEIYEVTP
ncbi:endo-1,4-beta-xylanase [Nibricoccus sp. IMCC34717]|uniref:endo-1,4-beta-xylanase n=1 Tax=Nibricoccus sp. IMCC34717 TaxID=3034021 RepID=UPI00384BA55F